QQTPDILDDSSGVTRTIDSMIARSETKRREAMVERMHQATPTPTYEPAAQAARTFQPPDPYATIPQGSPNEPTAVPAYNPYPASIHQAVIQPLGNQPPTPAVPQTPQTTSEKAVSP